MSKSRQPKKSPQQADSPVVPEEAAPPLDGARPDDNDITTYKAYKRDARLLGKIGALLDMAQQDTLAHFRREFENLYFTLLAQEQRRMQDRREGGSA